MIPDVTARALVAVLTLAENHQMWSDPLWQRPQFKEFVDETYEAIQEVRRFCAANDIPTLHALLSSKMAEFGKENGRG